MTEIKANSNVLIHVLADETLGGIKREYVEVDRKAEVGDLLYITKVGYEFVNQTARVIDNVHVANDIQGCIRLNREINGENFLLNDPAVDKFVILEPTDFVRIDGQRYEIADRKAKVGEKVIHVYKGESNGIVRDVRKVGDDGVDVDTYEDEGELYSGFYHGHYYVLVPLDKHEKIHKNKNSGYKEMKNLIHNELGITRQDIQEMISVAVFNEVQKMSESGKLDNIVGVKIESLIEEGFRDGGRLLYGFKERVSETVSEEVGKRIANVLNINVELKGERN
ncbi:hypothetical protein ABP2_0150 [Bacillus subtilis subsp. subtilis]|nr:hypothetical protein [Bacillus subtilis subsp. subtilis]